MDTERRKIENRWLAYENLRYTAAGVCSLVGIVVTTATIAGSTVALVQVVVPVVAAAKVVGAVVGGAKVNSSDVEATKDCNSNGIW